MRLFLFCFDNRYNFIFLEINSVFTETRATQTMKSNQKAELEQ